MRIISGTHKGRSIHPPKNLPVRPTTDFAKESLFNILNNNVDYESIKVLDLFCGTGNITYEFLSRGVIDIASVDSSYNCCSFIKKTIDEFKLAKAKVIKADVFSYLKNNLETYDVIFADPPYDMENSLSLSSIIQEKKMIRPDGWLIIEHGPKTDFSQQPHFKEKRTYGHVNFSFFHLDS